MAYLPFLNDPQFTSDYRGLYDSLFSILQGVRNVRPELMGQYNLDLSRLGTDQGIAQHRLNAGLANRGLFDSGIQTTNMNRLNMGYGRQRDDETLALQRQLGGLQQQRADAWTTFQQGLGEAYNASAQRLGSDPYAVLPKYGPNKPPPPIPKLPKKPPNRKGP